MTHGYLLLIGLFAASGCSGLILEILWQRQMMLVFGASAPAITAILTAFFFGIALGSAIGGRVLSRFETPRSSLRFYAATEAWIGLWALAVPLLLRGGDLMSQRLLADMNAEGAAALAVRFVLAVLVVLPATTGMGATIPVMSRLLHTRATGAGRAVSIAYGVNASGAVVGCVLAGFVLMQAFGVHGALLCAIGLNLCVSMVALVAAQRASSAAEEPGAASGRRRIAFSGRTGLLLAVYAASSFCALGLEVVWFRVLAIFNSNSLVTFTTGLATYILGYSIGSLALYPWVRRRVGSLGVLAISCLGAGLATGVLLTYSQLCQQWIGIGVEKMIGAIGVSFAAATTREALNAMLLMFVPTLYMGMAFPAVCDAVSDTATDIADSSGRIYFLGNISGAFGAMLTGLVLIPTIGIRAAGFGFAVLLMVSTLACATRPELKNLRHLLVATASIGAALVVLLGPSVAPFVRGELRWIDGEWQYPGAATTLLRYRTGASATVMVKSDADGNRRIFVDDQPVASTNLNSRIDSKMLAHIPLLLHPAPTRALTVGFGSGGTSFSMVQYGVETDVAEIEPEVVAAAPLFESQNHGVVASPLLRVVLNDARNHLQTTRVRYDVISTDVTNLQYRQNSSLYTVDYFELMKKRLRKGGIACAWIPIAFITMDEVRVLMRSFQEVFPHASFWFMDQANAPFAILIGTEGPTHFDYARLVAGFEIDAVRRDLEDIGVIHPAQLLQFIYLDEKGYRSYTGEGPLHTDDYPILEFETHVSAYGRGEPVRDRIMTMIPLKPKDPYAFLRGLPGDRRKDFDHHLEFARVWGEFTLGSMKRAEPRPPGAGQRQGKLLLETLELVPDYPFAVEAMQRVKKRARKQARAQRPPRPRPSSE